MRNDSKKVQKLQNNRKNKVNKLKRIASALRGAEKNIRYIPLD